MTDALVALVKQRAGERCEYCQLAQSQSSITFEIDHIIALKHDRPHRRGELGAVVLLLELAIMMHPCSEAIDPSLSSLSEG